jgi:undecaprenyl-diphosphatase
MSAAVPTGAGARGAIDAPPRRVPPPSPSAQHAPERRRPQPSLVASALRRAGARGRDASTTLGMVVFAGGIVATLGVLAFAFLATFVRGGRTQAFDDAVLRWLGAHRVLWLEQGALEVTFLGTGTVVVAMASVAALFLALLRQRTAAWLLLWSTVGALVLNNVLKQVFHRPRPRLFTWGTHALTTSFPSGHAMSAAAVYGTVALLAARLTPHRGVRAAVYAVCAVLIALVASSRLYLGVHYPSDVVAGIVLGGAWAAFCAAALEWVAQARRRRRRGDRPRGPAASADADAGDQPASIPASTRS